MKESPANRPATQKNTPFSTLLVPLLNQVDSFLVDALTSATKQCAECEIIVICAPSTCATNREIVDTFAQNDSRLRVVVQTRHGFPAALNEGVEMAKADRIGLLLTDDWLEPTAIEDCLALD